MDRIGSNDTLVLYELNSVEEFRIEFEDRWYKPADTKESKKPALGENCGVVIYQRQSQNKASSTGHSYATVELIGIPMLVSIKQGISGKELVVTVRSELQKHIGSKADDSSWKLIRTSDKWNVSRCQTEVDVDDSALSFEQREYLIIDWPERVKLSEVEAMQRLLTKSGGGATKSGERAVDLQQCFQMFTETDQLPETDAWYCNRCKEHREAFKKMEFWSMPPILVLQLKRFTYSEWSRDRLDIPVGFPLEGLDLSSYCIHEGAENTFIYDLSGVSIHMGGLGGGHYVAYARSSESGKWYNFNDNSVSEVPPATVSADQTGAYVLFYICRDHRPPGWGPPSDG